MTRKKRGRRPGSEGPARYDDRTPTNDELASRMMKKLKKRKGHKAGSRHSAAETAAAAKTRQQRDPRLGSKKPIQLVVEAKPHPKSAEAKKQRRMNAEEELAMLESDAQLHVLLGRIENGERLGAGLQSYVDEKLDRIETLMKQLGLYDEEEDAAPEQKAKGKPQKSDDDLLDTFDRFDENSWD